MDFGFECGKSGLRTLDTLLRGAGHGERDLVQALRLFAELADRFLLHPLQAVPFPFDRRLKVLQPVRGLLLHAAAGVLPLARVRLELRDGLRMPFDRGGPALQVLGVLVRHRGEPLLDRRHVGFRLFPETFDLRLEVGEALFEFREFQHDCLRA
jgi:hypothetical protein